MSAWPSCHGYCTEMWLLKCGTSFVSSEQRVKDVWKEWFLLRYNQKTVNCSKYLRNCSSHKNDLKTNTYTSGNVVPWQSQTTTRCHHCATNTDSFFTVITLQPSPQRDYYGNCYWYCSTCAGLLSETSIPASSTTLLMSFSQGASVFSAGYSSLPHPPVITWSCRCLKATPQRPWEYYTRAKMPLSEQAADACKIHAPCHLPCHKDITA